MGYELGDTVSTAPSPKGTGNRAHVLRYKQHMHMQPRSPAAALCAAAGDTTRASATPLAHEAGDEEVALQPEVDSLARGKSVAPSQSSSCLGGGVHSG